MGRGRGEDFGMFIIWERLSIHRKVGSQIGDIDRVGREKGGISSGSEDRMY